MSEKIYGVNLDDPVTPQDVKRALNECFYEAHCIDSELGGGEDIDRNYCETMIKKAFSETEGDYERPTKESLLKVMNYLQEFAKNFRDPEIIQKHTTQIMKLVERLK
jgi:hypothetical protein